MIRRIHRNLKSRGNRGFTLVELIISIAILVLIMLPLMNSFYRSAQLNKKAQDTQERSDLAANIMEGLRNLNIKETINQFTGVPDDFKIADIKDASGNIIADIKVLRFDESTGLFDEVPPLEYDTLDEQTSYYFAIYGIREGSTAYDALITMKSGTYKMADSGILNDFSMPDAINLDIMANGLLFSDGRSTDNGLYSETATYDSDAQAAFIEYGTDYAKALFTGSSEYQTALDAYKNACEAAEMAVPSEAPPAPYPEITYNAANYKGYWDNDTVKSEITKTMKIIVNQAGTMNTVEFVIEYSCKWPDGTTSTLQYPISSINYEIPIVNIYLFYKPSGFAEDCINVDNQTPANQINLYLAYQGTDANPANPKIEYDNMADNVAIFTNLNNARLFVNGLERPVDEISKGIITSEKKDRIYGTDIKICKYANNFADKFKDVLYTLTSATENSDTEGN